MILRLALPSPLRRTFDYLPPDGVDPASLAPGVRVAVPFGRGKRIGVLLEVAEESAVPTHKLRPAHRLLDAVPLLDAEILELAQWASTYYHHPIGETVSAALPVALRKGEPAEVAGNRHWRLTEAGRGQSPADLARAPRQAELLRRLQEADGELAAETLAGGNWSAVLKALATKGWIEAEERPCLPLVKIEPSPPPELNDAQRQAVTAVGAALGDYAGFLLEGVTGSGKTEVYLGIIERVLAADRRVLVLVPEIGLTPQLINRFRRRLQVPVALLHSGLNDSERLCAWHAARSGHAPVVLGTRSALFTPLPDLGLILIDEEHDPSFKQQEGFRYSARDLAVVRARRARCPIVLGSATPSLESLHNARQGRYRLLDLPERAGTASHPTIRVLDVGAHRTEAGLSPALLRHIREHLDRNGQVLVFLNRRGYAPVLECWACNWIAECRRCDAKMTYHRAQGRLICHHCGAERPAPPNCPQCGNEELAHKGVGTEQVEHALRGHFPEVAVARIDRDSTRRKGSMEEVLAEARAGRYRILLGTQMLAKGHHFPEVTLAAILDADGGLFSSDFRAPERLAQLLVQVAGRAGRAERPGEVLIQSRHPDHPLLQLLIQRGYRAFAEADLAERRDAHFPPFAHLALLRAEAPDRDVPHAFLEAARAHAEELLGEPGGVMLLGPIPAPMERRAGRYRAQLLLQADHRADLHRLLTPLAPALETLPSARKVRWSLDVDPVEMF
ncbi:primosomal protein N' [Endothiovibrio diazotrophicus]